MFAQQPKQHRRPRFRVDPAPAPSRQRGQPSLWAPVTHWVSEAMRQTRRQHAHPSRLEPEPPDAIRLRRVRPPSSPWHLGRLLVLWVSERRLPRRQSAAPRAMAPTLAQQRRQLHRRVLLVSLACTLLVTTVGGLFFMPRLTSHRQVSAPTASSPHPSPGLSSAGTVGADDSERPLNDLAIPPFSSLHRDVPATGLQPPVVQAAAAFLFDPERGLVFYEKHAGEQRSIASLTKVMTLVLAVDTGDLDRLIRVGPDAAALVTSANSYMGVSSGEQLTLRDLLAGLVVGSGNDAAVAIADGISGTQASFVALMNSRARRLGLSQTHFVTPDGMDDGNLSTAHDLAILTAIALMTPSIEQLTTTRHETIPRTATHKAFELWSSNDLLPGGRAPYPGANGVKSGYTERALYCLAFSARRQGHLLVGVVLGDSSAAARDMDAHALLDWGFAQE